MVGVLVYAENFNPPLGCFRLKYTEALSVLKTTEISNSSDAVLDRETFLSFQATASGMRDALTTAVGSSALLPLPIDIAGAAFDDTTGLRRNSVVRGFV